MIFAAFALFLQIFCIKTSALGETARTNMLRTSYDNDYFSVFETEGNTIRARGKYADDRIRKLCFYKNEDITSAYSMRVDKDGSYSAEITADTGRDSEYLAVVLTSGAALKYLVRYGEGGWYFPMNGLEKKNRLVLDHIYDIPDEAVKYHISPSADEEETAAALEQVRLLTEQTVKGLDSDYEKAKALSNFVADSIYYDFEARDGLIDTSDAVTLYGVLRTCRAICSGFADLYSAMLEAAGIECVCIKGGVTTSDIPFDELSDSPQNHEFTAFYCREQSRWVWVDSCWNGSGYYQNGEFKKVKRHMMYFDISDEALAADHRADTAERRRFFYAGLDRLPEAANENFGDISDNTVQPAEEAIESGIPAETTAAETAAPPKTELIFTTPKASEHTNVQRTDDISYIAAISVLAMAIAAVTAVIIRIFLKGKDSASAQRYRDMILIELENGKTIKLELYPEIAPETVANFEKLVKKGFYDGLTFHRVISGFMIQGGCPLGNGTGNSGKHIKGEFLANGFPNELKHTRGVISMARAADPNSASCQFFIMHEDAPHLDGSYAAFGKVIEGMDAVDEIASCDTDHADKPITPVVMKSVKIVD